MCVVSMVGDHYRDKWGPSWPPQPYVQPSLDPFGPYKNFPDEVSRAEFELLKKEVLEMKELLKRAIKYDRDNNQPNCEMEDKVKFLKQVAEYVGVTLEDVFKNDIKK